MKRIVLFLFVIGVSTMSFSNPEYAVNVWISTSKTNVAYSMGKGPVSFGEIRDMVMKISRLDPSQTVHLIANDETSMRGVFDVSKVIYDGGLTNIHVSMFLRDPKPRPADTNIVRLIGMSMEVHCVHDSELLEVVK